MHWLAAGLLVWLSAPAESHASIFKGEALDKAADVLTWVVLIVAPVVAIAVFWIIHILPEKIAEKKQHPQVKAIQCLCLLSLVFGGLLWPLAWLWTYSKPARLTARIKCRPTTAKPLPNRPAARRRNSSNCANAWWNWKPNWRGNLLNRKERPDLWKFCY
jgi:hypothetical protein